MIGKITDEEIAAMPAKSTRYEAEVKLYRENDFLTAYGLHTDKRIRETSYKHAIGGGDNWDAHGRLQWQFLKDQGLNHHHCLLDIGCGTGRLARQVVPYLDIGRYVGLDISAGALAAVRKLADEEGWNTRQPEFLAGDLPLEAGPFDFIWAYSVFIHLPIAVMGDVMRRAASTLRNASSSFLFSYVPEKIEIRTGLKQFRHTLDEYQLATARAGLTFEPIPNWVQTTICAAPDWAGHQHIALARRAP